MGTPRTSARKIIQMPITIFLNQGVWIRKRLLIFCWIVFFKKLDVLIEPFSSVKYIEIVLRDYKTIEFMVSKFGKRRKLFVECHYILQSITYSWQISYKGDRVFFI